MGQIGAICASVLSELRTGQLVALKFVVQIGPTRVLSFTAWMDLTAIINEIDTYEGVVDRDSSRTVLLATHRSALGCWFHIQIQLCHSLNDGTNR